MNSFFLRHEFLVRRLHSLSGLVPVGAYMTVHLTTNASLMAGPGRFQSLVNSIHNLGPVLPLVEWVFIFLPIIFHAVVGFWIAQTGRSNAHIYGYANNWRYTWQRYTAYIATVFIFFHVFHLHGWFHADFWLKNIAEPLGMAQFRPYNAASTLAVALSGWAWPIFYIVGVVACTYHLANGIWTAGITWGAWISPAGQRRASVACTVFGVVLTALGLSALFAAKTTNVEAAKLTEDKMYEMRVETGELKPDPHKRSGEHADEVAPATTALQPAAVTSSVE